MGKLTKRKKGSLKSEAESGSQREKSKGSLGIISG